MATLTLSRAMPNLVMLSGQGDGTFGAEEVTTTGSTPGSFKSVRAIAVDVDLDGDQDLVFRRLLDCRDAGVSKTMESVRLRSGDKPSLSGGNSMMAADVNFDGIDDIVTLAGSLVSVIGIGDGTFRRTASRHRTTAFAVGDASVQSGSQLTSTTMVTRTSLSAPNPTTRSTSCSVLVMAR